MKAERLRKIPLFEGLTDHQYERLERWTDEIDVPTSKHLVNQGAYPHEFMVIESGTAEVTTTARTLRTSARVISSARWRCC